MGGVGVGVVAVGGRSEGVVVGCVWWWWGRVVGEGGSWG